MSNQTYLNIENVVKQFGQFTALKDISLSIDKGEFVCFLGPSGCGKTTLLRAIAGLDLPTSGSIEQNGNDTTFCHQKSVTLASCSSLMLCFQISPLKRTSRLG